MSKSARTSADRVPPQVTSRWPEILRQHPARRSRLRLAARRYLGGKRRGPNLRVQSRGLRGVPRPGDRRSLAGRPAWRAAQRKAIFAFRGALSRESQSYALRQLADRGAHTSRQKTSERMRHPPSASCRTLERAGGPPQNPLGPILFSALVRPVGTQVTQSCPSAPPWPGPASDGFPCATPLPAQKSCSS
jgi:hypothetical protein